MTYNYVNIIIRFIYPYYLRVLERAGLEKLFAIDAKDGNILGSHDTNTENGYLLLILIFST